MWSFFRNFGGSREPNQKEDWERRICDQQHRIFKATRSGFVVLVAGFRCNRSEKTSGKVWLLGLVPEARRNPLEVERTRQWRGRGGIFRVVWIIVDVIPMYIVCWLKWKKKWIIFTLLPRAMVEELNGGCISDVELIILVTRAANTFWVQIFLPVQHPIQVDWNIACWTSSLYLCTRTARRVKVLCHLGETCYIQVFRLFLLGFLRTRQLLLYMGTKEICKGHRNQAGWTLCSMRAVCFGPR